MVKVVEAVYDGKTLHPVEPLDLHPNTRVRLTIENIAGEPGRPQSFIETALAMELEGLADWSENLDKYCYGDDPDDDE